MTPDQAIALRAPFAADHIKIKPQAVTKDNTKGLVTYYVDARLVAERLNDAVGAENWEDRYTVISADPALGLPVECALTVNGVTKVDVGQIAPGPVDEKAFKSAYSDAFKRAAVKFGVAAYLYDSPNVWAAVKVGANGKAQGFSDEGRKHAFGEYRKWVGGEPAPEPEPAKPSGPKATPTQQKQLGEVIAHLETVVPGDRNWRSTVDQYAQREFGHDRKELTGDELDQVVAELNKFAESMTA